MGHAQLLTALSPVTAHSRISGAICINGPLCSYGALCLRRLTLRLYGAHYQ